MAENLDENELIINHKKGKTKIMIVGTAKRLGKTSDNLHVRYRDSILCPKLT